MITIKYLTVLASFLCVFNINPANGEINSFDNDDNQNERNIDDEQNEPTMDDDRNQRTPEDKKCKDVYPNLSLLDPNSRGFIDNLQRQELLIPEGSPELYDALSIILTNYPMINNDMDKACFKRKFVRTGETGKLYLSGFGTTKTLECSAENYDRIILPFGTSGIPLYECRNKNPPITLTVGTTFTDGWSFAFFLECFGKSKPVLTIATLSGTITDSIRRIAQSEIPVMGLANTLLTHNYMKISYGKCGASPPPRPSQPPPPRPPSPGKHGNGGICDKFDPITSRPNYNRDKIIEDLATAYIPVASTSYFSQIAQEVGVDEMTTQKLRRLCPRIFFSENVMRIYGFGIQIKSKCSTTDLAHIMCTPDETRTKLKSTDIFHHRFLWFQDGCALVYSCTNNNVPYWALLCNKKEVKENVKERAIEQMEHEIDFDRRMTYDYSYKECTFSKDEGLDPPTDKLPDFDLETPCTKKQLFTTREYESLEKQLHNGGWYLTMGSKEFYDEMSFLLTGKDWDKSKGTKKPCLYQKQIDTTGFDDSSFRYYISGFDSFADILCKPYNTDGVRGFRCNNIGYDKVSWNSNPILTDGKNFIAFASCFGPKKSWYVLSKNQQLSKAEQDLIYKKLGDLGIKGTIIHVPFENSCPDPNKVVDTTPPATGPCYPNLNRLSNNDKQLISDIMSEEAWIPRASYLFYKEMSNALKGNTEPPPSGSGASGPCLRRTWNDDKTVVTFKGYEEELKVACTTPDKMTSYSCVPKAHSNKYEVYPALVTPDFVLIVGCVGVGTARKRLWYVVSKYEHLSTFGVDITIKEELRRLHFSQPDQDHATCSDKFTKPKPVPTLKPKPKHICPDILSRNIKFTTEQSRFIDRLWDSRVVTAEGSPDYFRTIKKYLKDSRVDDYSAMECSSSTLRLKELVIKGYGKEKILDCRDGYFSGVRRGSDCQSQDDQFNMKFTPVWTDGRTSVLFIGCSGNGKPFWFLSRPSHLRESIKESDRDQIKKVIKDFGFDIIWEKVPGQYCENDQGPGPGPEPPVRTTTKRTPTKKPGFDETQCDEIDTIPVWEQEGYTKDMIVNSLSTSYIPFADSDYFYQLGEEILGRPISSLKELSELCLRVKFSRKSLKIEGYGEETYSDCDTSDLSHIICRVPDSNNMKKTFHHKILWFQDGCAFSVSCALNGKRNWALICKTKTISPGAKSRVLKMLQQLSAIYADHKPFEFSYKDCKFWDDQKPPPDPTGGICDPTPPTVTKNTLKYLKIGLIQNVYHRNKCLRVIGNSIDNSAKYQLATCDPKDSSQLVRLNGENTWQPSPQKIVFDFNGKCMSADTGSENGVLVMQWDCVNKENQLFGITNGNYLTTFELQSRTVGKCLTPGVTAYAGILSLWHCHPNLPGNPHQFWRIRTTSAPLPPCDEDKTYPPPISPSSPSPTCNIRTESLGLLENFKHRGKCLHIVGSSTEIYAATELVNCDPNDRSQLVQLRGENTWAPFSSGTIIFTISGLCIDPKGQYPQNGVILNQYTCLNRPHQFWKLINGHFLGDFQLQNQETGRCYSTPSTFTHAGNQIQHDCLPITQAPHQYWRIRGVFCHWPDTHKPPPPPPVDDCIRKEKEGKPIYYTRQMPKAYDPAGEFVSRYPDGCLVRRSSGVQKPYPYLGDPNGRYPYLSTLPVGGGNLYPNRDDYRRDSCLNIPMANKNGAYNYGQLGLSPMFAVKVKSNGIFFVLCCFDYYAGLPQLQYCNQVTEEGLELSCGIKPNERDSWPYRYDDVTPQFKTCLDTPLVAIRSAECRQMHTCFCGLPGIPPTVRKVNGVVTC